MRDIAQEFKSIIIDGVVIKPLTSKNWIDFEKLFGPKGAYAGCWCMWWRLSRKEFESSQGEANCQAMRSIVDSGTIPGLLAYIESEPCGWCSVAPRNHYNSLERSRVLKQVDDNEVWSIVCFFIHKKYRRVGLGLKLIRGAIEYVKSCGGEIVESYPTVIRNSNAPPVSTFMGIPKIFKQAGFKEISRASQSKLIMRYYIK